MKKSNKMNAASVTGISLGVATGLMGALSLWGCGGGSDSNNSVSGLPGGKATRAQVLRGRYIVTSVAACADCHSGDQNLNAPTWLAGFKPGTPGQSFAVGPFTTYAANITPDKETGIGNWTSQQIFNAFRTGKDINGKFLAPPMPWPVFRNMSDDDTWALVAYLQNLKPSSNAVPESQGPPGADGKPDWSSAYQHLIPLPEYPGVQRNERVMTPEYAPTLAFSTNHHRKSYTTMQHTTTQTPVMPVSHERLFQLAWSYAPPLLIEAAVRHGVFDLLHQGPKTLEQIAGETNVAERPLRAVLNALTGLQLLAKEENGKYDLAPESAAYLVSGRPGYMGDFFRQAQAHTIPTWLQLSEVVRTGKPVMTVNEPKMGAEYFEPFVEALFPIMYPAAQTLADALNLSSAKRPLRALDLAAGSGVWGIALAEKSPMVEVTAVDWPGVLPATRRTVARLGLDDRFHYVGGDLLEADFGDGYDVATLGHILHSMGEADSRTLLHRASAALKPGGTIAIAEFLVDEERVKSVPALIFAVMMATATEKGDTFSLGEISQWLREAGFENIRMVEVRGPSPLVLATKSGIS